MPDYQNGKIYKIISPSTGLTYYGSTVEQLSVRLAKHRWACKNNKGNLGAFPVLACGDAKIYLVEKYPCNDVEELHAREGYYQQNFECVNERIAGRKFKEWYQENRDQQLFKRREYYHENRDVHRNIMKQNYKENKEAYKKRATTRQKRLVGVKIQCECGDTICVRSYSKHKKTIAHQQYMLNPFSHM